MIFTLKFLIIFLIFLVIIILSVNIYLLLNQRIKNKLILSPIKTKFTDVTQSWVINLLKNRKRLQQFNKYYMSSDIRSIPLKTFNAINGQEINVEKYVTPKAYKQILFSETHGYRVKHYELTRGAVGCYLSHVSLYKKLLEDKKHKYYIIFEDDAQFQPEIMEALSIYMDSLPSDWDLFELGTIHQEIFRIEKYFTKLKVFWGLFGYVINKTGARKFIQQYESEKINKQIDSMMSIMTINHKFNVYGLIRPLVKQDSSWGSDIQVQVKRTDDVDPFTLEGFVNSIQLLPDNVKEIFTQEFLEEFSE